MQPSSLDHSNKYRGNNQKNLEHRRRNRHDNAIELRKTKREDNLAKRRNINLTINDSLDGDESDGSNSDASVILNVNIEAPDEVVGSSGAANQESVFCVSSSIKPLDELVNTIKSNVQILTLRMRR